MLKVVNAVMDTHFLTPVGPSPRPLPNGRPRAEAGAQRYLVSGKYKLFPFDQNARPYFDDAVAKLGITLSDYSFTNNVIWLCQASGFYQIIDECFCLFSLSGNGLTMLLPPLGAPARQLRALKTCIKIMDQYNPSRHQARIDFVYKDFVQVLDKALDGSTPLIGGERWHVEITNPDYIYRTQDLIELRGNAFKTKRNEINQFRRAHPDHELVAFCADHREPARALVNTWTENRIRALPDGSVEDFLYNLELERKAINRTIALYDELGLQGLSLFIDGRLEGFTFGERLNPDVANVLIEKTNFNIQGAAQYLFREFAKVFSDCTYINVGDDLGFENLRRVKMSYRPAMFGEKVVLRRELTA